MCVCVCFPTGQRRPWGAVLSQPPHRGAPRLKDADRRLMTLEAKELQIIHDGVKLWDAWCARGEDADALQKFRVSFEALIRFAQQVPRSLVGGGISRYLPHGNSSMPPPFARSDGQLGTRRCAASTRHCLR